MSLDCSRIHQGSLRLLERVGVAFHAEEALDVFRRHGLTVEGNRVLITEERLSRALAAAPPAFVLRGRGSQTDLEIGGGRALLASASGCPYVRESGGEIRPGTIADFETTQKLGQQLANIDMNGQCVEPQDLPVSERYRRELFAHLTLSDKPAEYPMALPEHVQLSFDTLEILHGAGWDADVRLLAVANSMSPLQFSAEMGYAAVRVAERGQVVCVTPSAIGGMTAPATLAGLLVVQNAEVLAGLLLTQLVREGCPFVYGGTSSLASMATGDFLVGVPQFWTLIEATVAMARFYGLPCRAGGALTDAYVPDYQAGMESALGLGAALRAGADYVLHAAGVLGSFSVLSFEKLVLDDQLAGALRAALAPVATADDDLALQVSEAVAGGGSYLTEEHTLLHCRDYEAPTIFNRSNLDAWRRRGEADSLRAAGRRVAELLEAYEPPALDPLTRRQLEEYCLRE